MTKENQDQGLSIFPPEGRMLSSSEMGTCFMREDELFSNIFSLIKRKPVYSKTILVVVHSIGAALQNNRKLGVEDSGGEWWGEDNAAGLAG